MATLAVLGAGSGTKTLTAGSDTEHPLAREIRQIVRINRRQPITVGVRLAERGGAVMGGAAPGE